jgi:nucleoid DNA-binding protein
MKKPDIAKQLARQSGISRAAAADELDRVVNRILSNLKKGENAPLPGLGVFTALPKRQVGFEPELPEKNDGRE